MVSPCARIRVARRDLSTRSRAALADPEAVPATEALRTPNTHHWLDEVPAVLGSWIAQRG
jgi:hypothetical protein